MMPLTSIIQAEDKNILQQYTSNPINRGEKFNVMLKPTNKTIHTILQPPKEVSLSYTSAKYSKTLIFKKKFLLAFVK
jgi:hypothetical protein